MLRQLSEGEATVEQAKLKAEALKIKAVSSSFSKLNFINDFKNINYNTKILLSNHL